MSQGDAGTPLKYSPSRFSFLNSFSITKPSYFNKAVENIHFKEISIPLRSPGRVGLDIKKTIFTEVKQMFLNPRHTKTNIYLRKTNVL